MWHGGEGLVANTFGGRISYTHTARFGALIFRLFSLENVDSLLVMGVWL